MKKKFVLFSILSIQLIVCCLCVIPAFSQENLRLQRRMDSFRYCSLEIPLITQQTEFWCWAAGGAMIMSYLENRDINQCQFIELGRNQYDLPGECCNNNIPVLESGCTETGKYPIFPSYLVKRTAWGEALSWRELWREIGANSRPVGFIWEWEDQDNYDYGAPASHYMVAIGLVEFGSVRLVEVNDPALSVSNYNSDDGGGQKLISYGEFVEAPKEHLHLFDQYGFTKNYSSPNELLPLEGNRENWGNLLDDLKDPREVLKSYLKILKQLPIDALRGLGYNSNAELASSTLGETYVVSVLDYKKLLSFQSTQKPMNLVRKDIQKVFSPVYTTLNRNQPVTGITLRKRKDDWTLAFYGGREGQWVQQALDIISIQNETPLVVVQVLQLNFTFLAFPKENEWMAIPVHNLPGTSFSINKVYNAKTFLEILRDYAKNLMKKN